MAALVWNTVHITRIVDQLRAAGQRGEGRGPGPRLAVGACPRHPQRQLLPVSPPAGRGRPRTLPADADDRLDVAAVFDLFRAKLRDIAGWELADEVSLTNLSFAGP